jgi:hypothetical protein
VVTSSSPKIQAFWVIFLGHFLPKKKPETDEDLRAKTVFRKSNIDKMLKQTLETCIILSSFWQSCAQNDVDLNAKLSL